MVVVGSVSWAREGLPYLGTVLSVVNSGVAE